MSVMTDHKTTISMTAEAGKGLCGACSEYTENCATIDFSTERVTLCPSCLKALAHLIALETK